MVTRTELEIAFAEECTVIFMAKEYPGYTGEVKCVILTELSEKELSMKYADILPIYFPYLVASSSLSEPIDNFNRNEDKYKKRMVRNTGLFALDDEAEKHHQELCVPSVEELIEASRVRREIQVNVRNTLKKLTDKQRRRLIKHVIQKKTWKEIAEEEGCADRTVGFSIQSAKKKFQKFWRKDLLKGTPLSKHNEGVISMSGAITSSRLNRK